MTVVGAALRIAPSLLARKVLCSAYVASPFTPEDRFRFQGLHAIAAIRVIARHLKVGYRLRCVELCGKGYRIDLLFEADSSGRTRIVEVKSSKRICEVHRIQAALYDHPMADEIVVSNRESDETLSARFIQDTRRRAEITRQLLASDPEHAASKYTPHSDVCRICANSACPFLSNTIRQGAA
jgi:hypothetical protein